MITRRGVKLTFFIVVAAIAGSAAQMPTWVAPLSAMAADAPAMTPPTGPQAPPTSVAGTPQAREAAIANSIPQTATIPLSSPLYYVTFVRVYGSAPEVVYVGYTPGYLGTVAEPDGTVVDGTGYVYEPWVGAVYYPPPATCGIQAQPVYNTETGMACGMTTAAMMYSWNQPIYYSPYYHGYPCCGSASANVYGHYGSTSWSWTRTWYSQSDGDIGQSASGSYTNYRTGSTGSYSANRCVNPYDRFGGRGDSGGGWGSRFGGGFRR
jgi:hypothetical protein